MYKKSIKLNWVVKEGLLLVNGVRDMMENPCIDHHITQDFSLFS